MTDSKYAVNILDGLLGSLSYNRDDEHIFNLYDELVKRFKQQDVEFTDDGDIVYGTMVMIYGDYGTSPRTGWFYDKDIPDRCAQFLIALINTMKGN